MIKKVAISIIILVINTSLIADDDGPSTTLSFNLPEVSNLKLIIYNMLGQKVKTYNMQNTPAGNHSLKWNATNDYGDPVGAGVYLYQLQAKDFVKTRKMVLLK
jgi:flagellar hook assembly protein FlgD